MRDRPRRRHDDRASELRSDAASGRGASRRGHRARDRVACRADAPVAELAALLASAEALGLSEWCVETAAEHARTRVQFGRPIGQFQAVKHRVAEMLVALETARAAVWDAARAFDDDPTEPGSRWPLGAARGARARGGVPVREGLRPGARRHRLHVGARRPPVPQAGHGDAPPPAVRPAAGRRAVAEAVIAGDRRALAVDLPPEAEPVRERTLAFVEPSSRARPKSEWTGVLADSGYLVPHWPKPWGLDADPVEQLVIDEELRRRARPAAASADRRLGAADDHQPRHARAAGAVGPGLAAGRDPLVPDVQRARRRQRPGQPHDPGGAGRRRVEHHRAEGVDHDGPRGRLGDLPGPDRSRRPSARRHRVLPAST